MNSLEQRLQVGISLSLVLLMITLWAVGSFAIKGLTEDFVVSRLEHDAESLLAALVLDAENTRVRWRRINQIYNQPLSGHYYLIHLGEGRELTSRSLWDQTLQAPRLPVGAVSRIHLAGPARQQLLLWAKGYQKDNLEITIAVAEDLSSIQHTRDQFMGYFALLALGGLAILLAVQRLVVHRSFQRLEPVREDIRLLEQGKKDKLSEAVPTEILPLVQELNQLLELMTKRLERSRNALGNLAHALKGPLNLLVHYFDCDKAPDRPEKKVQAEAQVERIRQLMERELKHARLVGRGSHAHLFNPHKELPDLVPVLQQVHRDKSLKIKYRVDKGVPAFADREDMLELLGNLLDNACKWASSSVSCRLSGEEWIQILVEDDGDGLSDSDLERLTQRGTRLDETVGGHGLGLAIAKDIVKLYNGSINFGRSTRLGGLQVQIILPNTPVRFT